MIIFRCLAICGLMLFGASGVALTEPPPPDVRVWRAHRAFTSPDAPDPSLAETTLRRFAIEAPAEALARNLSWVRQSDWSQGFKALFAKAVHWADDVRKQPPADIYRLSRDLRTQPEADERNLLARALLGLAAERGHPAALHDRYVILRDHKHFWPPMFLDLVREAIEKGDPVSMAMMAERYENGEGTEVDLAKAYYWYLRAERLDPSYRMFTKSVGRKADEKMRLQALRWLAEEKQPDF
jgi:hypothetical protein